MQWNKCVQVSEINMLLHHFHYFVHTILHTPTDCQVFIYRRPGDERWVSLSRTGSSGSYIFLAPSIPLSPSLRLSSSLSHYLSLSLSISIYQKLLLFYACPSPGLHPPSFRSCCCCCSPMIKIIKRLGQSSRHQT